MTPNSDHLCRAPCADHKHDSTMNFRNAYDLPEAMPIAGLIKITPLICFDSDLTAPTCVRYDCGIGRVKTKWRNDVSTNLSA